MHVSDKEKTMQYYKDYTQKTKDENENLIFLKSDMIKKVEE